MQLRNARLCLDCEEVHEDAHCPACASESFAFITRWVPAPAVDSTQGTPTAAPRRERRERPPQPVQPVSPETLDTYRQLLSGQPQDSSNWRVVKRGALGLALFGLAGWAWKQNRRPGPPGPDSPTGDQD